MQISFVGLTQDAAEEQAQQKGFPLGISKTSFKANSKVGVHMVIFVYVLAQLQ